MTLADKIKALPEWPESPQTSFDAWRIHDVIAFAEHCQKYTESLNARLALAREWIDNCHHEHGCPWQHTSHRSDLMGLNPPCTCGRDALLAALTPPEQK